MRVVPQPTTVADEKKKFPVAFIAVAGVVLLLLAGGISYLIASKIASEKAPVSSSSYEPGILYKIGDPKDGIIVNIGGVNGGHYIKTSIVLELRPSKKEAKSEGKGLNHDEVKMSDSVIKVLRAQKLEDFDASKHERLKEIIKSEVNTALGGDKVMNVFITSFVLQ